MKDKICLICHTAIDTSDEFCSFRHYKNATEIKSKAYYHVKCFSDRMSGAGIQKVLAAKAMQLINKVEAKVE